MTEFKQANQQILRTQTALHHLLYKMIFKELGAYQPQDSIMKRILGQETLRWENGDDAL